MAPSAILDLVWRHSRPPRLVFDGPNILLKLHVDLVYTLEDIVIFFIQPVRLEFANSHTFLVFGGYYPQMNSDIVATPKRTVLAWKYVTGAINRENPSTGLTGARARE